jgi:hypothetical protein
MDDACSKDFTQDATTGTTGDHISGETQSVSWTDLKDMHNIVISVADEPLLSGAGSLIDTSPLQHTVYFPLYIYSVAIFLIYARVHGLGWLQSSATLNVTEFQ